MIRNRLMTDQNSKKATIWTILFGLLFTPMALGGELKLSNPYIPRPYAFAGVSINGAGYSSMSEILGGGLRLDSPRLITNVEAGYNDARKANDGTMDNRKGSTRSAQARVFYRLSNGLYIGGGAQWSHLSTTNYAKQAWHPTLGIGKDFLRNTYSLRLQGMYVLKGTDKINGSQGPEISLTYPSPQTNHRFFFRSVLGIYYFHTTITEFSNQSLVKSQGGDHHITGYMMYNLIFRL
jgi:hypothetical protein